MARSRSPTVSSDEPMQQLPLSSKLAGGRKEEVGRVGKSGCGGGGGRGKRKRGGARGLEECEANARTKEDKGSGGLETLGLQATKKGLDFPQGSENQLVIRLREPMQ